MEEVLEEVLSLKAAAAIVVDVVGSVLCVVNLLHMSFKIVDNFAGPGKVSGGGGVTWGSSSL